MGKQKFTFRPAIQTQDQSQEETNLQTNKDSAKVENKERFDTSEVITTMLEKLEKPQEKSPLDQYKIIPRHKVRNNKKNDYPMTEMESLKDSILRFGLVQDISVLYLTDEDMYVIEAGHRRRLAIDQLIEEFADRSHCSEERYELYQKNVAKYEYGYVCKVSNSMGENEVYDSENEEDLELLPDGAIDSEIRLIITNQEVRSEDPLTKARNVQRLAKLYARKNKNLPKGERIHVNDQIAKDLNESSRNVAYYKNVGKLIPELQEELKENNLTVKESSAIAALPEEEQKQMFSLLKQGASSEEISVLVKQNKELAKQVKEKEREMERYVKKESASQEDKKIMESLQKELEDIKQMKDSAASFSQLVKEERLVKASLDQAIRNIKELLHNIEKYQISVRSAEKDISGLELMTENELQEAKESLIKLLS